MKRFYTSKTFWFGLLWVIAGIAGLFGYYDFTPDANWSEYGQLATGLITILLRWRTSQAIK